MTIERASDLETFDFHYDSCCSTNEQDCNGQIRDTVREFGIKNPTVTIIEIKIERDYRGGHTRSYRAGIQIQYILSQVATRPKKTKMTDVTGSDLETFDFHYTSCCSTNEKDCNAQIRDIVRKFGIQNPTVTIIEIKIERDYRGGYTRSYRAGIQIQYILNKLTVRPKKTKRS
jgi:peptidase E